MPRSQGTSRKGKPKKGERASGMGRALQREQRNKYRPKPMNKGTGGMAYTGAPSIGMEGDDVKVAKSVLEIDDLTDFLGQAELAGREFLSEREQFVVLDPTSTQYNPVQKFNTELPEIKNLSFPRRPKWTSSTTPEELNHLENLNFVNWRRDIAQQEEILHASESACTITPFEKNIEMWRQLWRVLERSDVLLQIVDGRNPLFFYSEDLGKHVQGELGKRMVILVNKGDYLTTDQRAVWADYFSKSGLECWFFSAKSEQKKLDEGLTAEDEDATGNVKKGMHDLLTREELLANINGITSETKIPESSSDAPRKVTIGTVGFPNVGKSSVINVLLGITKHTHNLSRVGVASQPGKTKHFQTLHLSEKIILCDCPGLVFPSLVNRGSADLIANGVYPIDQMRDLWSLMDLLLERIPLGILNAVYTFEACTTKSEGRIKATEILTVFCRARGWTTPASGLPDYQRACKLMAKDYVDGRLLYCHYPPNLSVEEGREYRRETLKTLLVTTQKLRDKLGTFMEEVNEDTYQSEEKLEEEGSDIEYITDSEDENDVDILEAIQDDEDDIDILGVLEDGIIEPTIKINGGPRGKAHKSIQKHGKKGRKTRNKDPYGCHSEPDDTLASGAAVKGPGLVVKAGKYGSKGYTRPDYAGARSAVKFEERESKEGKK